MRAEYLLESMGEVRDEHIRDAEENGKRRLPAWAKWAAGAAACLLLLVCVPFLMPRMGSGAPAADAEAPEAGGGSGHDAGTLFMSYAGPLFPLTLQEDTEALIAERKITYDFSSYGENASDVEVWGNGGKGAIVRDEYLLRNLSEESISVIGIYPIAGDYQIMEWPTITADGHALAYEIVSGSYTGGFRGAGDAHTTSVNLENLRSWEGYAALLEDGGYMEEAFAPPPALDTPVAVYELRDITDGGCGHDAATLALHYRYHAENTHVMTYGFNGGGEDPETGEGIRSFFIREGLRKPDEDVKYLLVIGEDIADIRLQGYENGACEPGGEIEGPAAALSRSESTMGEVLKSIAQSHYAAISGTDFDGDHNRYLNGRIPFDMYYGDIVKYFARYGPMGTEPKERYSFEWGARLEDIIGETAHRQRILYLCFPLSIPAGDSVELCVERLQNASFDFHCSGSENVGVEGYDMLTSLGSNLRFRGQKAAIINFEAIEIVRQNFGFDPENSVTEAALNMSEPHYYLEVREIR